MVSGLFILIGCELAGEVTQQALHLPVPGPVVGLFILAAILVARDPKGSRQPGPAMASLNASAGALIRYMGLLFVPAGAGIVAEADVIKTAWLPLVFAMVISTMLSLVVTGLVMHWISALAEGRPSTQHTPDNVQLPQ